MRVMNDNLAPRDISAGNVVTLSNGQQVRAKFDAEYVHSAGEWAMLAEDSNGNTVTVTLNDATYPVAFLVDYAAV